MLPVVFIRLLKKFATGVPLRLISAIVGLWDRTAGSKV